MTGAESQGGYEFTSREEAKIAALASRTVAWGVVSIVISVLMVGAFVAAMGFGLGIGTFSPVWLIVTVAASIPVLVLNGIVAILYIGAGRSLRAVVKTQQEDVSHVLDALARLSGAFRVELIVSSIGVLGGVVLLLRTLAGGQ